MPKPEPSKQFRALCYEHHIEMKTVQNYNEKPPAPTSTYACQQQDCLIHYAPSNGYFTVPKNGILQPDRIPRVRCLRDGQWMYLAEINRERINFRLWRCPQCDATRTNDGDLVVEAPH